LIVGSQFIPLLSKITRKNDNERVVSAEQANAFQEARERRFSAANKPIKAFAPKPHRVLIKYADLPK
jgi:hypothetical protein